MKKELLNTMVILLLVALIGNSCKKDDKSTEQTPEPTTVTDINGNVYNIVKIGNQTWTKENLKVTKLSDGTAISNDSSDNSWGVGSSPAYCWYENDFTTYGTVYGALYNWYAVSTGKLCPAGWHVPSDAEWTTLLNYVSYTYAGKLKETGTTHWFSPNTGATNESGFTALPGGRRYNYASFSFVGEQGSWWSSTLDNTDGTPYYRLMYFDHYYMEKERDNKTFGFSVRCLKD